MSIVQKLTEGIVNRNLEQEGQALLSKWSSTGLLEGLQSENSKHNMARLLENQARELLREVSTMESGAVEGFAAVAFPIVRRVFAGLIANDLVSVQPMSLPSGLIFFLDFKFNSTRLSEVADTSIYGQGVVGQEITGGVNLNSFNVDHQPYAMASAYGSPTGSVSDVIGVSGATALSGTIVTKDDEGNALTAGKAVNGTKTVGDLFGGQGASLIRYDGDLKTGHSASYVLQASFAVSGLDQFNSDDLTQIVITQASSSLVNTFGACNTTTTAGGYVQVKRLTKKDPNTTGNVIVTLLTTGSTAVTTFDAYAASWPQFDDLAAGTGLGSIKGTDFWGLENETAIPEIDIKVDSIAITARTKKLKAKWTPELGQDLNAYHNLDAEVELTSILSEQIALEIDREILQDLVKGRTAATYYWSRSPGLFVNRVTGAEIGASSAAPDFTGTVSEWYETLIETINDVSAQIHRKTLRGAANFIVCSPEVANILEFTAGFRANVTADADKGEIGAVKVGSLNRKFDVIVDPYFARNVILVGRKGSSFLESGYVYAPYVPLQTTPTIFGPEDFVPRKGVMTRYGKKMVRPDMYGLVVVRGLIGEAGATS